MIIAAEKLAAQNSAYRHRNMKGAFGNEGALRFYRCSVRAANANNQISGYGWLKIRLFPEQRQNFFHQCVSGDTVFFAQDWNGAMFDELIRPTYTYHRRINHFRV